MYLTSARGRFWVNEDNDFGYECYWSEFLLKYEEKLENQLFDKPFAYFRDCLSPLMKMKDGEWKAEYAIKYLVELREKYLAEFSDYFEHTSHVETVVLLSHKKPDGHINVKVEFGEGEGKVPLDNIAKRAERYKPKERVTYKMIKEYIEAKYGFKVHTAYIAEVKRDLGLPMYDAPNAVEELKQPRKHPTAEKVEAIKDALKHFEVI